MQQRRVTYYGWPGAVQYRAPAAAAAAAVPIQFVQYSSTNWSAGATIAVVMPGNITAGSLIVVGVRYAQVARSVTGVTDSLGNTYQQVSARVAGSSAIVHTWYAMNATAGACTVTVTFDLAPTSGTAMVAEYSGILTAAALDKQAGATGLAGVAADSGLTAATAQNNELLVGVLALNGSSGGVTAGAGYTLRSLLGASMNHGLEDQIVAVAGAYNATFTWVTARNWACQIATFKGITP